jgi:hypothetical protein
LVGLIYFLPTMNAYKRGHKNAGAIGTLTLLLGWTVLGWIIAAVWSATDYVRQPERKEHVVSEDEKRWWNMNSSRIRVQPHLMEK